MVMRLTMRCIILFWYSLNFILYCKSCYNEISLRALNASLPSVARLCKKIVQVHMGASSNLSTDWPY